MTDIAPLIMFDGPDGVGKSTQLSLVQTAAEKSGLRVYVSRMLGGTPFGEELRRAIFVSEFRTPMSDLYVALAMAHTLAADLETKRAEYDLVLIDRSPLSIMAFQVAGSGLEEAVGKQATDQELQWIQPSIICVYEATQQTLLKRLPTRSQTGKGDYFEDQDHSYHERVASEYSRAVTRYPELVVSVDANDDVHIVHERTLRVLRERLNLSL